MIMFKISYSRQKNPKKKTKESIQSHYMEITTFNVYDHNSFVSFFPYTDKRIESIEAFCVSLKTKVSKLHDLLFHGSKET